MEMYENRKEKRMSEKRKKTRALIERQEIPAKKQDLRGDEKAFLLLACFCATLPFPSGILKKVDDTHGTIANQTEYLVAM